MDKRSSIEQNNSTNELLFNSGNHNLGTFDNALSRDSKNDFRKIVFDFPLHRSMFLKGFPEKDLSVQVLFSVRLILPVLPYTHLNF